MSDRYCPCGVFNNLLFFFRRDKKWDLFKMVSSETIAFAFGKEHVLLLTLKYVFLYKFIVLFYGCHGI